MSIQRISKDNIENFTLFTYPERTYTSSSSGITGSVLLFVRDNRSIKDALPTEDYGESAYSDASVEEVRRLAVYASGTTDISGEVSNYLQTVNQAPTSEQFNKRLEVTRFTPSVRFTKDSLRKTVTKNVLFPDYRTAYPDLNYAFTNYHCLNFFTASSVPSTSALIYPAFSASIGSDIFPYSPSGSFTFEFFIKPSYKPITTGSEFKPGSILHLSSSYCLSLISGSTKDSNGNVGAYRVMLQLSHSADVPPSTIYPTGTGFASTLGGSYLTDLIYTSSEIPYNEWKHVAVRWEAPNAASTNSNAFSGSFVIDGVVDTQFIIPSSSIIPQTFANPQGDPDALFVGNYYDGINDGTAGGGYLTAFFNINTAYDDGLTSAYAGAPGPGSAPERADMSTSVYNLDHPLNAELHDIRIYDNHRLLGTIQQDMLSGPTTLESSLLFYVPVFFVKETRTRNVLQTPFKAVRTTTDDPFNIALSFGTAARLINLPNFTREFVRKEYPRLFHLTASEITISTPALSANTLLYEYSSGSVAKANLTVLPCDNGKFAPGFELLRTGSDPDASPPLSGTLTSHFRSDSGVLRYDLVNLNDLVSTASILTQITPFDSDVLLTGTINAALNGPTPEDPGLESGSILTVLDRTRDPSSNEVTFFDASNLFYGRRITYGSFAVTDSSLTGSDGRISMTLKDNSNGGLYRADADSAHATWSKVGSIVYDEGVSVVTDPTAIFFGQDQFEATMQGIRPLFVKAVNVLAPAGSVNSSSNPNFIPLRPTDNENETANKFVYITHVNLHDDNLNIIGKATLAQPLVKRDDDKYLVRLKMDY